MSYKELIESVSKYNSRILQERRGRIPYHDPCTNISHHDGRRIYHASERSTGSGGGQIFTYSSRRWKLKPRPPPPNPPPIESQPVQNSFFHSDSTGQLNSASQGVPGPSGNGMMMTSQTIVNVQVQHIEQNSTTSSQLRMFEESFASSRDSWSNADIASDLMPPMEESESNDRDFDTDDDYEDSSSRKKKGSSKAPSKVTIIF